MIRFDMLNQMPDAGNAFLQGFQNGRAMRRQRDEDNALSVFAQNPSDPGAVNALLAVNPQLGLRLGEYQRDSERRNVMGRLFNAPAAAPEATDQLVDPQRLPPRTDGLTLNQEALRELYRIDPESALQVQKSVFDADRAQFDAMRKNSDVIASAAFRLRQVPVEQRPAEFQAIAPMLAQMGVSAEQLGQVDLSDAGLDRYMVVGRAFKDILSDERADRRVDGYLDNLESDNERADRNTASLIADRAARRGLTARGQDIASADRRRGQDMTDKRVRETGGGRRGRGGQQQAPTATDPKTGKKV